MEIEKINIEIIFLTTLFFMLDKTKYVSKT
jgi:hypothetical protein